MKRITLVCLAVICLLLSACGNKNAFIPDYESAIGIIIVNDEQKIPTTEKMYADGAYHRTTDLWKQRKMFAFIFANTLDS